MSGFKQLDIAEKIQLTISYAFRMLIVVAIIGAGINKNWITLFMSLFALLLTFLPSFIQHNYKIYLPVELEFIVTVFIYASLVLGEIHEYYTRYWWWDLILHSTAGVTFGLLGFFIMYILHRERKIATSPILIALFSFSFAVAIGSVWEVFEFSMDHFLGLNMQKSGLQDTMWDMIVNGGGALFIGTIGYAYMKRGYSLIYNRLITRLKKKNPRLFRKYVNIKRNL